MTYKYQSQAHTARVSVAIVKIGLTLTGAMIGTLAGLYVCLRAMPL